VNSDRVTFTGKGTLDEIVSSCGAHLERMGRNTWFLIFHHEDSTETALWFTSTDLVRPSWEKRTGRSALQSSGDEK
jgi:hypothetical protein